jgi:hypothetical protein
VPATARSYPEANAVAAAKQPADGFPSHAAGWIFGLVDRLFGALCTAVLLAIIATIPVLQFFALGYLLNAAGRLAKTGKLRDGFVGVREASRIGQVALGAWLATLPYRLFANMHTDALLIAPRSGSVRWTERLAIIALFGGIAVTLVALSQGGQLVHFFRPLRASRRLVSQIRAGGFAASSWQRLRTFVAAFGAPKIFSLGLRGYLGAGLWLAIPTTIIALTRGGPLLLIGMGMLVVVLVYVPFTQIHFAVHDKLPRIFQVDAVQYLFKRAPVAFFVAFLGTLLLALPLYLLKIELVPRDALWLPAVVFVLTIFPTKLLAAWAYHRGARRAEPRHWFFVWTMRALMIPVALFYAFVVFLTQYTGWHGVFGLYEHHAFLLPVPF